MVPRGATAKSPGKWTLRGGATERATTTIRQKLYFSKDTRKGYNDNSLVMVRGERAPERATTTTPE